MITSHLSISIQAAAAKVATEFGLSVEDVLHEARLLLLRWTMISDPRLRSVELLTLAAYSLQQRRQRAVPDWRYTEGISALLAAAKALPRERPVDDAGRRRTPRGWVCCCAKPGSGHRRVTVALDPRLADGQPLALAALRLTQRQPAHQVRWIDWADRVEDEAHQPPGLSLPRKMASPTPGRRRCAASLGRCWRVTMALDPRLASVELSLGGPARQGAPGHRAAADGHRAGGLHRRVGPSRRWRASGMCTRCRRPRRAAGHDAGAAAPVGDPERNRRPPPVGPRTGAVHEMTSTKE